MPDDDAALKELRLIRGLLSAQLAGAISSGQVSRSDAIARLDSADLAPREIAEALGTTPNAVSVALTELRKQGSRRSGRGSGSEGNGNHGRLRPQDAC